MLSWDNWTGDIAALEDPEPEAGQMDDMERGSGLSSSEERCSSRIPRCRFTPVRQRPCMMLQRFRSVACAVVTAAPVTRQCSSARKQRRGMSRCKR